MSQPDPDCPECHGSGRRVLFQLPEPCPCTDEIPADVPAWREQYPNLEGLRALSPSELQDLLFPRHQRP